MSVQVKDFLRARKDRATGAIMGHLERQIFPALTREQQQSVRQCVIDALNTYHDSVLDLVKADDSVRNERVLEILERLDQSVRRISKT